MDDAIVASAKKHVRKKGENLSGIAENHLKSIRMRRTRSYNT